MDFLDTKLELKSLSDDGAFSGYGSVFNVHDYQGDVVRPGAFKEIVRNDDGRVVFLWQHERRQPIATAAVHEDAHGLHFDGNLILADPQALVAQAHMRAKSVRGVSIGYEILASKNLAGGGRELTSIRLHELSLVTFPANPSAQVTTVKTKSILDCTDEHELRNLLRERDSLSRTKADAAADALWRILRGADDPEKNEQFAESLKSFFLSFRGNKS